jgi:hypothetical protein
LFHSLMQLEPPTEPLAKRVAYIHCCWGCWDGKKRVGQR